MSAQLIIKCAAISGFLAVALGAFGAHGLKGKLPVDMMNVYQTAVQYQFYHTMALLAVAILMLQWGKTMPLTLAAYGFVLGIIVFSGSLYVLSLSGIRWLGAIAPVGGTAFLVAWLSLFIAAFKVI